MEQRISLVTLGVENLERSGAFYDQFGWDRSVKGAQGVVFYQMGGLALGLFPRKDLAEDAGTKNDAQSFSRFALACNTRPPDEVDRTLAEAEAAGGSIVKPAAEAFWGGYSAISATLMVSCGR